MKKCLVPLVVLFVLRPAVSSAALPRGLYFGANVGWAIAKDNDRTGSATGADGSGEFPVIWEQGHDSHMAFRAAVGYGDPHGKLRSELELAWQKGDYDVSFYRESDHRAFGGKMDGYASSLAFMFTSYYDFKNRTAFTPFLGAGIGYARQVFDLKNPYDSRDDEHYSKWHLAMQAGGGVGYAVTEHVSIEVKYLYYWPEPHYHTHNVYGGLRYTF